MKVDNVKEAVLEHGSGTDLQYTNGVYALIGIAGTASIVMGDVIGAAVVDRSERKYRPAGSNAGSNVSHQ